MNHRSCRKTPKEQPHSLAKYCRTEGISQGALFEVRQEGGRVEDAFAVVRAALGHEGLRCSRCLCDAVWRWVVAGGKARGTVQRYVSGMAQWIAYSDRRTLGRQLATRSRAVQEWVAALQDEDLSARTVRSRLQYVSGWYSWLCGRRLLVVSPIDRYVSAMVHVDEGWVRKADGRRQALYPEEAQKVAAWALQEATPEQGLGVLLQMVAGLRANEVCQAQRSGLRERDGVWTLTIRGKGGKHRTVRLEPVVVAAWQRLERARRLRGTRGYLVPRRRGGCYDPHDLWRWSKLAAGVVGRQEDISSHDLRRTAISLKRHAGASDEECQLFAGHADRTTTSRCYTVYKQEQFTPTGIEVPGATR